MKISQIQRKCEEFEYEKNYNRFNFPLKPKLKVYYCIIFIKHHQNQALFLFNLKSRNFK